MRTALIVLMKIRFTMKQTILLHLCCEISIYHVWTQMVRKETANISEMYPYHKLFQKEAWQKYYGI